MRSQESISNTMDWTVVTLYFTMVLLGWLNIFAAVYDVEVQQSIFDLKLNSGKQLIWIGGASVIILVIMLIDFKLYESLGYVIYLAVMFSLVGVLLFGREVAGSRSWFDLGFVRVQPAEFAKFAVSLGVARFLAEPNIQIRTWKSMGILVLIMAIPALLIIKQGDTGSALVFAAFVIVFYREGMHSAIMGLGLSMTFLFIATLFFRENYLWYLVGGIGVIGGGLLFVVEKKATSWGIVIGGVLLSIMLVLSVDFIISDVMKPHQRKRIEILVKPDSDPMGVGWQVTQSKIAIGSGGIAGKGFLQGTQTKFDFVPNQSTDFIFCTVGEEHGWLGSMIIIGLFITLLYRLVMLAERQKERFARVYIYCVACVFFFHFMINIGMTIGLFPVIGIPLPFFSYGGSSLWSFTILLFIAVKLDAHRMQVLAR